MVVLSFVFFYVVHALFYLMMLVGMQYKYLLEKKGTKIILQTFNSEARYVDGLKALNDLFYFHRFVSSSFDFE